MERTQLAGSGIEGGIEVSRIGLGTWAIGGWMWGGTDDAAAVRTILSALERGVNLIDTAPIYGHGHSETLVGRALAQHGRRDEVVVATKVGLAWGDFGVRRDSSPARIRQEVEDSLRRLGIERIDLYQVHWPDEATPFADTAATLKALQDEGKIRAIGVSNFSPAQMDAFRAGGPLHTNQPPYNLFERGVEADVLPHGEQHGLTQLTYGVLCRGLLSGRMRADTEFTGDDLRQSDPKFQQPRYGQYLQAVERLDALAQARWGKRVIHLAARWVLDRGANLVPLWGARRPDQLDALDGVFGWSIDAEGMAEVDRILAECVHDPVGPEFMAPPKSSAAG